jgi:hypothetical protein
MERLLTWYDQPIRLGQMESANNKSKTMKRQVDGHREMKFFKLKILSFLDVNYALVGRTIKANSEALCLLELNKSIQHNRHCFTIGLNQSNWARMSASGLLLLGCLGHVAFHAFHHVFKTGRTVVRGFCSVVRFRNRTAATTA